MMKGYLFVAWAAALVALLDATCSERGCCRKKDNKCMTTGPRMVPSNHTTCFCDETCLVLGDCCQDYPEICVAEDCVVGDWEDWSECSAACDWGHKTRTRPILRERKFGGRECDATTQKTYCYGQKCKGRRAQEGMGVAETGSVIPAEYGSWRKDKLYNPYIGIRKNLFDEYYRNRNNAPSYCATFEITDTRKACREKYNRSWAASFDVGQRVCVECQPSAMKRRLGQRCRGHGAFLLETRWKAVTVPGCHGEWKMVTEHEQCQCDVHNDHSFIFV